MITNLIGYCVPKKKGGVKSNPLNDFVKNASSKEKKKILNQIVRAANEDQRKIMNN